MNNFIQKNAKNSKIMHKKIIKEKSKLEGGDEIIPGDITGLDRLTNKKYNKGLSFTLKERQLLGIHGLLAPCYRTQEQQIDICMEHFYRIQDNLQKYIYLTTLAEWNEKLFYKLVRTHLKDCLPYIYTPVVGEACLNYGFIYLKPKGLYITIEDKGHVADVLQNWPETDVRAICVTDGGRILGLGDLGAHGMGIPIGKLALYTALGGVKPHYCLPITLDLGCNNVSVRENPLYIGLRRERPSRNVYDEFMDEFMEAVAKRWSLKCLIQFEDFATDCAFRYLQRYRKKYSMFNDDIQGTAAATLAGILAAMKIVKGTLRKQKVLFFGAGEAAMGIASLLILAFMSENLTEYDAHKRIWMFDSNGLIVHKREKGPPLSERKLNFAHKHPPIDTLEEAVRIIKPTILIGASAVSGAFTPPILRLMAEFNKCPIIFALSNPHSKSECSANDAYQYTKGKCIYASGSPYPPVMYEGHTYITGLANNAFIFPSIALAATSFGIKSFPDSLFLWLARTLCDLCTEKDFSFGRIYPPIDKTPCICFELAICVANYAYANDLAILKPQPTDIRKFLKNQLYETNYDSSVPRVYLNSN